MSKPKLEFRKRFDPTDDPDIILEDLYSELEEVVWKADSLECRGEWDKRSTVLCDFLELAEEQFEKVIALKNPSAAKGVPHDQN